MPKKATHPAPPHTTDDDGANRQTDWKRNWQTGHSWAYISKVSETRATMAKGKPKYTRGDAERLFGGLAPTGTRSASRPVNPFEDDRDVVERPKSEPTIWSKETVWLPLEIELPPGYKTVDEVREAMSHAWGMTWISETREGLMVRLADGWEVVQTGGTKIYDGKAFRAEWATGQHAKLRLLCRYRIESKFDSSDDRCQLVVRDGEVDGKPLKFSAYAPESGPRHPEWAKWRAWLDREYPGHDDPFKYWTP